MSCGANHKRAPTSLPPQPARPPAAPPVIRIIPGGPLTPALISTIARYVEEVIGDGEGWGSVDIVIEHGRVLAVRKTTSQLFLDALLTDDHAIPHGDNVKK